MHKARPFSWPCFLGPIILSLGFSTQIRAISRALDLCPEFPRKYFSLYIYPMFTLTLDTNQS